MKNFIRFCTLFLLTVLLTKLGLSQECETTFTTDVFYTNPCTSEDFVNDDDILNTNITVTSDYKTYFRTNETVNSNCSAALDIKKPIIIIEGFDIDKSITPSLIHDLYINRYGAGTQLRNQGYDIITYNITSPIISIDVNAKLFAKFIQFVNNQKEGDEEIIIMGVSMGGLVTRHALTYMEENNIQHQTKLFISFDSPQAGHISQLVCKKCHMILQS